MEISVIISDEKIGIFSDEYIACYLSVVQSIIERDYPHANVSVGRNRGNFPIVVGIRNCPAHMDEDTVCHLVKGIAQYVWDNPDFWWPPFEKGVVHGNKQ